MSFLFPVSCALMATSCASVDVERDAARTDGVGEFGNLTIAGVNHEQIDDVALMSILPTRSSLLINADSGEIWLSCSPGVNVLGELWHAEFGIVPLRRTDEGHLIQRRRQEEPLPN